MRKSTIVALVLSGIVFATFACGFVANTSITSSPNTPMDTIAVCQIPEIVKKLGVNRNEGSWAAFAFASAGERSEPESVVNLQYSYENGTVGLDWVLLAPRNVKDREKFSEFVRTQKHKLVQKEANGVKYLRVEDGDIVNLGLKVMKEMYRLTDESKVEIFTDGFE